MIESKYLFYLFITVLTLGVLQALTVGCLFLLSQSGDKRANSFYAFLLITFGLTLLHNIFKMTGFFEQNKSWYFIPIYFTLAFPPLLFYYVKLSLYPSYKLRWTDAKHFLLPIGQCLFFLTLFFTNVEFKSQFDRHFYNPFYGAFEQFLYLATFLAYMYFAFRYIRQKRKKLRDQIEAKKVLYLRYLIQILFVLFCVHTIFVVWDFVSYEFLNINLRTVRPYAALGALSFAALIFWLGTYGIQVLLWGKKVFK